MKEWSDEELDKLFRKSAEELEPPYEPDDWKELRHRLDDADQVPGGVWLEQIRPWTIALLLLMIVGGVSVYYNRSSEVGEKRDTLLTVSDNNSSGSSAQKSEKALPATDAFSEQSEKSSLTKNTGTIPSDKEVLNDALTKPRLEDNRQREDKTGGQPKEIKELPRNLANVSGVRKQTDLVKQERGDGAILLPKGNFRKGSNLKRKNILNHKEDFAVSKIESKGNDSGKGENTNGPGQPNEELLQLSDVALRDNLLVIDRLEHKAMINTKNSLPLPMVTISGKADTTFIPKRTIVQTPAWALRAGISPDLSVVNMHMKGFTRPGPAASLLIERRLIDNFALQTGVIRSLKTYSAKAGEYQWPSNWYQKQMPVSVDGSCQVFEIPLNIRYDISQREKTRWFATVGVSSYKMQKEKYVYHYEKYDPNIRWWKWEGKTGWYFFSHANASAGYERRLTSRLSITAEPYVRLPLRKVGFGKVNLFTTGIWFSVRYTPVFGK